MFTRWLRLDEMPSVDRDQTPVCRDTLDCSVPTSQKWKRRLAPFLLASRFVARSSQTTAGMLVARRLEEAENPSR